MQCFFEDFIDLFFYILDTLLELFNLLIDLIDVTVDKFLLARILIFLVSFVESLVNSLIKFYGTVLNVAVP